MAAEHFYLSSTNPNEAIGGGGCLCYPVKGTETQGPYAIFTGTETDSGLSPHAVLCLGCAAAVSARATEGDLIQAGELDVIDVTYVDEDALEL